MAAEGHFLVHHMYELIQNVTMVKSALDGMRQINLLTDEQYDLVTSKETTQDQMRELYRHVKCWPHSEMDKVYLCLKKTNPVVMANAEGRPQPVMASSELRDGLTCSICLDISTDPVTLTCGHNFCRACFKDLLYTPEASEAYTCPKCRAEFKVYATLKKASKGTNVAEGFASTQSEKEEIGKFCTNCNHCSIPADKSCLMCDASLCDNHMKVHSRFAELVLSHPISSLENRKYSIHKKTEDTVSTCVASLNRNHNRFQEEALTKAYVKKKRQLRNILERLTSEREETKQRVQRLYDHDRGVKEKAADIVGRVTVLFRDIRRKLEVLEKRVLNVVTTQEKQVTLQVSDLIQHLQIKLDELSKKMCHIEELCYVSDPVTVLQEPDSDGFCDTEEVESDNIQVNDIIHMDEGLISATFHTGLSDIITGIKRGIYVQELTDIVLDVNTAENHIHISDDLKTATWSQINLQRPETPERFNYSQVFSSRCFSSGLHYWEVEISETGAWRVGMSYSSVGRKGEETSIGNNNKSWSMCRWLFSMEYAVLHNREAIELDDNISCRRFGIYLDYEAGRLSFYELCNPIRHLHTFTATFTEPLHAAIYVWDRECDKDCWVRIRSYEK
ncbi:E3 ubiquitin-protein ligase TRIM39-like [Mixophyes fleayi]|uniref:E3 ubiquitin-protein ligase TRIM39-like n=1 Tax=Mixophyes fleayi TaxID=3061075 RepID=UPI003F4E0563